jgi:SAM-dependent methyltransferase
MPVAAKVYSISQRGMRASVSVYDSCIDASAIECSSGCRRLNAIRLSLFIAMQLQQTSAITKGDIINRLIVQFGLKSFLEYNKIDGKNYFDQVVCDQKAIAYLPEAAILDAKNARRLLVLAGDFLPEKIVSLEQLLEKYADTQFDIIFIDPVHVRPAVDYALQALPRLLKPDGFLLMHDCNPEVEELTSRKRRPGEWMGETYKALAVFHHHNPGRVVTVTEDYGVGIIWNNGLVLDYPIHLDIDYAQFAAHREACIGILSYDKFLELTDAGVAGRLFGHVDLSSLAGVTFVEKRIESEYMQECVPLPSAKPVPWHITTVEKSEAQLFWRVAGGSFSEEDSLSLMTCRDGKSQHLRFVFPARVAGVEMLRFDFADCAAAVRLESMCIVNAAGNSLWRWDCDWTAVPSLLNVRMYPLGAHGKECVMIATSDDPRLHIVVPHNLLSLVRPGWAFEVMMASLPSSVYPLLLELTNHRDRHVLNVAPEPAAPHDDMTDLQSQIVELQEKNRQLEQRLRRQDDVLQKLKAYWQSLDADSGGVAGS